MNFRERFWGARMCDLCAMEFSLFQQAPGISRLMKQSISLTPNWLEQQDWFSKSQHLLDALARFLGAGKLY